MGNALSQVRHTSKRTNALVRFFRFLWKNWFNVFVLYFFLHLFFFKKVHVQITFESVAMSTTKSPQEHDSAVVNQWKPD